MEGKRKKSPNEVIFSHPLCCPGVLRPGGGGEGGGGGGRMVLKVLSSKMDQAESRLIR